MCYTIINLPNWTTEFINLTGRFPRCLSRGNEYILIRYNYNANHIRAVSIKNRKWSTMAEEWKVIYQVFTKIGIVLIHVY